MSKNHVPSFMLLSRNAQFLAKSALLKMLAAIIINNFYRHNVERLKVWAGDFGEGGVWCFIYKFGL